MAPSSTKKRESTHLVLGPIIHASHASTESTKVAEKKRISDWCSTGLYHFTRARDFVTEARAMIAADDRVNNEFYVAPVYNRLIAQGREVRLDVADEVWVLGTPEDLQDFEARYRGPTPKRG